MDKKNNLVWVDCEMSGLNPETSVLLEISVIITDLNLNIIAEGPEIIIHQNDSILNTMDEWCTKHHGESGLTERVRKSDIETGQAQRLVLDFLRLWTVQKANPLCGNSIHTDRLFLLRYMPEVTDWLSYRIVDVSSMKELVKRWYPKVLDNAPPKKMTHRYKKPNPL